MVIKKWTVAIVSLFVSVGAYADKIIQNDVKTDTTCHVITFEGLSPSRGNQANQLDFWVQGETIIKYSFTARACYGDMELDEDNNSPLFTLNSDFTDKLSKDCTLDIKPSLLGDGTRRISISQLGDCHEYNRSDNPPLNFNGVYTQSEVEGTLNCDRFKP